MKVRFDRAWFKGSVNLLLDQILVFPMVVVLLVSLTLLCGGRCALWQWWGSVAVVLAFPFWRNNWKTAVWANLWFLVFLLVLWVASGISVTKVLTDCHSYHYPAMRMLMLGWNPIWESTCEAIDNVYVQISGGQPGDFWMWPVFSMPRPVWYFSAVAAFFTNNQFDLYHPILVFFWIGVVGCVWKSIGNVNVLIKIVSGIFIVSVTHSYPYAVDMVMALAALGLFSCFYVYLKRRVWRLMPMVCFSFWMCSAKQPGIAFCAVSWLCFVCCVCALERRLWRETSIRALKAGGLTVVFALAANISPYVTSWAHYSHPLYPQFSFDKERFPVANFTKDFLDVNDDARAMSNRLAMFLNAYVSPELVRNYYEWKLDRPNFMPNGRTWKYGGEEDGSTPLNARDRYWIMVPIVLMIIFGGVGERFVSIVMLLCMVALPAEMIGYLRYVTMVQFSLVFCMPMIWRLVGTRRLAKMLCVGVLIWIGWDRFCYVANRELSFVNDRLSIHESFKTGLPNEVYYNKDTWGHRASASLNLLSKLIPCMEGIRISMLPREILQGGKGEVSRKIRETCAVFPDHSLLVPKWYGLERMSPFRRIKEMRPKPQGAWARSLYEFNVFWLGLAADLPRAIWLRITGQIDNHMKASDECRVVTRIDACAELLDQFLRRWEINLNYVEADEVDSKIAGTKQLRISYPNWMMKDGRQGVFIEGDELTGGCELTFSSAGEVLFALKGVRINQKDAPPTLFYADYESFTINGKEMLENPISVLGTKPHRVRYRVEKGEKLKISARLKPHRYERDELRLCLLATSGKTFVTEDIVDQVMDAPEVKKYVCETEVQDVK